MNRTLKDVSQTDFDTSKALTKELVGQQDVTLDLRDGTALADLLIGPRARLAALDNLNIQDVRSQMSFKLMQENPELSSVEAMDNLAANFNITRRSGQAATGKVMITVATGQEYTAPSGYRLLVGTRKYKSLQAWRLIFGELADPQTQLQIKLDAQGRYYFILPMEAEVSGSAYNLAEGAALTVIQTGIPNIKLATVYEAFGGGVDTENNTQLIARLPAALSQASFSSTDAITTRLMNNFQSVYDLSVIGMGDEEMPRDKHNVFGIAMGSRLDVYVKTFRQPYTRVMLKTAYRVSDSVYTFDLTGDDAPGYYCIRSITSPTSIMTAETDLKTPALGGFPFTDTRRSWQTGNSSHDFSADVGQQALETAYSVWQASTVVVTNIPAILEQGAVGYPETLQLKVELYVPAGLREIQAFVDSKAIANKESDTVVKSALLAFVTMKANVYRKPSVTLSMTELTQAVVDYINAKTFGETITTSQLSSVMHQFNIVKVGLEVSDPGMRLEASVRGADGVWRTMSGSDLDVMNIKDSQALVSPNTVLFVADPRNIFLTERTI